MKGLSCVGWYGGGTRGTLDGWGFSGRQSTVWRPVLPDEEESELIAMLSINDLEASLAVGSTRAGQGEMSKV